MDHDDDELIDECECGCREAGFAFASLALPAMPQWPVLAAPWRPRQLTR